MHALATWIVAHKLVILGALVAAAGFRSSTGALLEPLEHRVQRVAEPRHLVVGELQLVEDAGEERDLAARHAEGVDGARPDDVDLQIGGDSDVAAEIDAMAANADQ